MKKSGLLAVLAMLTLLCVLCAPMAMGQAVYGSILGTVTDPSGAAVPNAKVTVTNQRKGTVDEATTNDSGNYSVTHLIPDIYTVRIEGSGFKILEYKDVTVSADTGAHLDAQFQVGSTSEQVEVTAEAPQLKTDRADVAIEFNARAVEDLPIFNRNFTQFELLSPGTQRLTGWSHASTENPQGSQQIFVNGQHFSGTAFELDGTDNQDPILGIIVINPNLDSVTETKVTLQNFDAEFGKALGGVVTTQTKSGSNDIHGSGFFFNRNKTGTASDPFSSSPIPNNTWKQYGGSIGGPVIKNKLFFFADYQGTRRSAGTSYTGTVPTALIRSTCLDPTSSTCDLSEYLGQVSGGGQVFNPNDPIGSRTAYTGNSIPKADLLVNDPTGVAASILSLLPAPNAAGTNGGIFNNFSASGSGTFNDYGFNTRWDYSASQKLQVFGRFSLANFKISGAPVYGTQIGGSGFGQGGLAGQSVIHNRSLAAGFDYALSNTLLTDFRLGWFQYNPHSTKFDGSVPAATNLGLPGLNTSDSSTGGMPAFFFDGTLSNFGEDLNISRCNCPLTERERQIQFVNNWTKIKGNHQFKFGADLRHASNLRTPSDANRTGELSFNHQGTSDGNGNGGLDLATFLFADVTHFNRYVGSTGELSAVETQNRYFVYGQDTWRVTSKLTLNYGLRWELYTPESVNGKGNGGFAVLPEGVIRVAGFGGISDNGNTANTYKAFAPRIGVAYQVNPKTVVRVGYGRSFDIGVFGTLFGHTVTQNLPVLANQEFVGPTPDKTMAFNFTQGPPQTGDAAFPVVPDNGILPLRGPTGTVQPHVRPDIVRLPTIDAWNLSVQRQINNTTSVDIAFVGNKGTHVFQGNGPSYNANTASIVGFATGVPFNNRRPFFNAFTTPYTDANGITTDIVCCDGDLGYAGDDSNNAYRALQIKVDKRMSQGLQLMGHYTYSRAYDHTDNYPIDPNVTWGRDDFNRNSVFVLTSLYELPFGKGKRFMGNAGRAADLIIGGWQWNTTFTIGSGLPWTPSYGECNSDRDTGPCRPSIQGSFHVGAGSFDPVTKSVVYFTPVAALANNGDQSGAFIRPDIGTFGNVKRNSFTGPGEFMSDMSLFKNFTVTERIKAQFRAEFFNVFNHPVLGFSSTQGNLCIDCGGNAGLITSLQEGTTMRQMQLGVRVTF